MNFGFFVQKWPFCDAYLLFKKERPETPIFIVFFGCALFGPRCQKRRILKSHQEKWTNLTDNWKAIFWYFCFFGGGFFFLVFLFPLFFLFFVWFFFFSFLCFLYKKPCFSTRKGHFLFIFSVSLSFSLSLLWPPSFSVSLSLSLDFLLLSFFFLSFFLLSFFLLVFLFCFLLVPCFCLFLSFLSSLLLSHERNNIEIVNSNCFLHQSFLFFWFPLFFSFKSLCLIFAIFWF